MKKQPLPELIASAKAAAEGWTAASTAIARAHAQRDRELWRFLTRSVKIARAKELRSAKKIGRLIAELNPALDAKALSRYGRIVRAAVKGKPPAVRTRDWVKRHGGISRFRNPKHAESA